MTTILNTKSNIFNIGVMPPKEQIKAFALLSQFLDILENSLEQRAEYSQEFISGLKKSLKETREKKFHEIDSLLALQ